MIGQCVPVQVVDEPSAPCVLVHEAKEVQPLGLAHMVGNKAADDEVPSFRSKIGIVAGAVGDRRAGWMPRAGNRLAAGVEINADQFARVAATFAPAKNAAQHSAIAIA